MFLEPHLYIDVTHNTETFQRYVGSTQQYIWASTVQTVHEAVPFRKKPLSSGHQPRRIANARLTINHFEKFAERTCNYSRGVTATGDKVVHTPICQFDNRIYREKGKQILTCSNTAPG